MAQQHTHTHTHLHTPGVQILKQSDQQTCQDQVDRILTLPQVRQLKVCRSVPRECPSMGMSSGRMELGRGRIKGSVRRPGSPHHPEAMEELTPGVAGRSRRPQVRLRPVLEARPHPILSGSTYNATVSR